MACEHLESGDRNCYEPVEAHRLQHELSNAANTLLALLFIVNLSKHSSWQPFSLDPKGAPVVTGMGI